MEVPHDSIFGGHFRIEKTKDRIQTNFCWPGMQGDVISFCRSCDACQKTTAKGTGAMVQWLERPHCSR